MRAVKDFARRTLRSAPDRLWASFLADRDRWPLWLPVLMAVGAMLYFSLPVEPRFPETAGMLAATLAGVWWMRRRMPPAMTGLVLCLTCVAVGFVAAQWRTARVEAPQILWKEWGVTLTGTIVEIETMSNPKAVRVVLDRVHIDDFPADKTPRRVRIQSYHLKNGETVGDRLHWRVVLNPPPPPVAPRAFDFQRHLYFKQIGAVGFSLGRPDSVERATSSSIGSRIERLRHFYARTILSSVPSPDGALILALITSQTTAIPRDVQDAYRQSGLTHILSISGLHIGLVAGFMFMGIRLLLNLWPALGLRLPVKQMAAIGALMGSFFYLLIAGAPVPTQRAFIMAGLAFMGVLFNRRGISLRLVAIAAGVILLLSPESVLSPSFQMSFMAVVGLVSLYEWAMPRLIAYRHVYPWRGRLVSYALGIVGTTLVCEFATLGLGVYHFNYITSYNVVANALAIPIVSFWVMPLIVLNIVTVPLGLGHWTLPPVAHGLSYVTAIAQKVVSWPSSIILIPYLPVWGLLLILLGVLWLCLWAGGWRRLGLVFCALGIMAFFTYRSPDILVSDTGKLIAFRDSDGQVYLSTKRAEKFAAQAWLNRLQEDARTTFRDARSPNIHCDPLSCVLTKNGHRVSIVSDVMALKEDCLTADVIIFPYKIGTRCAAPVRIDGRVLRRQGPQALWLDNGAVRIETVLGNSGERPWNVYGKRYQ